VPLLLALLLFWAAAASAVEEAGLAAASVAGAEWRAEGVRLRLLPGDSGRAAFDLHLDRLTFPALDLEAAGLDLSCPRLRLFQEGGGDCREAKLDFALAPWKRVGGGLEWRWVSGRLALALKNFRLGRGRLEGRLEGDQDGWGGNLNLEGLRLAPLLSRWASGWSGSGALSLAASGSRRPSGGWKGRFRLAASKLGFSDEEGLHVGEALALSLSGKLDGGKRPQGDLQLRLKRGQLYLDPFYLEFERPLTLNAEGWWNEREKRLHLERLTARWPALLELSGRLDWRAGGLREGVFRWRLADLAKGYALLLQPLLIGTPADALQLRGRASGSITLGGGEPRAFALALESARLEDEGGRFGFDGLSGRLYWKASAPASPSRLSWTSAHLYRVALGGAEVGLRARPHRLEVAPFAVDLLRGRLELTGLIISGLPRGPFEAEGGAELAGLSLKALSAALDWPPLEGKVDASLPRFHYAEGRLRLEGDLVLKLFGGRVVVEGLTVEDLLGPAPVLRTRLRLENLDLAQLSRTFSFGRIEGSLEGWVRDLRLVGWEVAGFEAELRSPPHDARRHRISQRAIDDLTKLGNGVAAGLSGTFLGLFKDFAYDRLQLRVTLHGDTAELDGAPGPGGGYYIVKGALLPRVDVIGRNRRVAWKDLLARLRAIQLKGIVVE